jgi:hypothetical protein
VLIRSLQEYASPILLLSARFRRGLAGSVETARRLGVKKVLPSHLRGTNSCLLFDEVLEGAS